MTIVDALARHRELRGYVLLATAAALLAWPLCRRGIVVSDEGFLLLQALEMLQGKALYRDMDAFVAPGIWLVLAGIFKVAGPSVIAARVPALVAFVATALLSHRIASRVAGRAAGIAVAAGLGIMLVWGFPAWTWSFYSPFAVLFALASLDRLLVWQAEGRRRHLLAVGLLLGLSTMFKQNYGALASAGALLVVLAERIGRMRTEGALAGPWLRDAAALAGGGVVVVLPVIAWLAWVDALPAAYESLVLRPFTFAETQAIPFLSLDRLWKPDLLDSPAARLAYAATPLWRLGAPPGISVWTVERLHVLLYWVPPSLLALGLIAALAPLYRGRDVDRALLAVTLVGGFLFLGVLPRADFNHLVHVYQPVLVLAAVLYARALVIAGRRGPAWRAGGAVLAVTLVLPWAAVAGYWYAGLLRTMNTPLAWKRGGVLVSSVEAGVIDYEVAVLRATTAEGEPALSLPDLSMINFLAEQPAPTAWYNFYPVHIRDQGVEAVRQAEKNSVRLALVRARQMYVDDVSLRSFAPRLASYLRSSFEILFSVRLTGDMVLLRRAEPLPQRSTVDVLPACDIASSGSIVTVGAWFARLHQNFESDGTAEYGVRETSCELELPRDAVVLSFLFDYTRPIRVAGTPLLDVEVVGITSAGSQFLLSDRIPISAHAGRAVPPPREYRVDVSHLAGQRVTFRLRSIRWGNVRISPFDGGRFEASWGDVMVERG